ncbi:MAG: energy-coupling factor transporter transmembrane component T [Lachnospiraceae bacterium]|nr:energy-coupling factor transporter transmembrane component T [Lachnospiraceae bacterium]
MKFDYYHPMLNFIYFVGAVFCMIFFDQPVFLLVSYTAAFIYSIKLNGKHGLLFNLSLIPAGILYVILYADYNHYGVTSLGVNSIGNKITLEAICGGLSLSMRAMAVIMLMSCMFAVVSSDKVVYLFGRLSPKLSLFLSVLLRSVPRCKEKYRRIHLSRRGIGKGTGHGNVLQRCQNALSVLSIVITWTLEDFVESGISMKSRGYSLKGRTAFSIYRFDNRDRLATTGFAACLCILYVASAAGETQMFYNPEIMWKQVTPLSCFFYLIYMVFLLIPFGLQVIGEARMRRLRQF